MTWWIPPDWGIEPEREVSWWQDLWFRFYARILVWSARKFYPYFDFWEQGNHEAMIWSNSPGYLEKATKIKVVKKRAK